MSYRGRARGFQTAVPASTTDTSYLGVQAAALSPGQWVQLSGMSNLTYSLITDPSGNGNILDYCNKGGSDYPGRRLLFQGGAHTGTGGLTGAISYNRTTNTWASITPSYSSVLSHNWDSSCADTVRGDFYAYSKTSSTVRRLPSGGTTWTTIAALNISTPESLSLFWDEARDGLMAWNRNTGLEFWAYSTGSGSWTSLGDPGIAGSLGMTGHYCRVNNELFLSDGSTNTTKFWMYQANNTFSSPLTAPVAVFANEGGSNLVNYDFGSQRILVTNKGSNAMRAFDPVGRTWKTVSPLNGDVPLNINTANTDGFSIAIPDLGCTLFFSGNTNFAAPSCYLYRHSAAVES